MNQNFIVIELHKQVAWSNMHPALFHYRTQTGHEVDIVMESSSGKVVGIEVKAGKTSGAKDFSSLKLMSENLGEKFHRGIILYMSEKSFPFGSNLFAMPVQSLWHV